MTEEMPVTNLPIEDVIELQQVLATYATAMTKNDVETVTSAVFTPDGTYSAFGETYPLVDSPKLVEAAPRGLSLGGPPVLALAVGAGPGPGEQPLCFVDQTSHDMRIG